MQLDTKYFGRIDYAPEDVLTFPNGLFGFEAEKSFLLLPFEGSDGNMLCLQSLAAPSPAFIAMMEVSRSEELCYYVMCVVREPVGASTLNLRCPLVINPDLRRGMQVILDTDAYHMRHRLDEFSNGGVG